MRVLLDTKVFLWSVGVSSRRTPAVRAAIDGADEVYVSAVSIWEAAIKIGLGKLQADVGSAHRGPWRKAAFWNCTSRHSTRPSWLSCRLTTETPSTAC